MRLLLRFEFYSPDETSRKSSDSSNGSVRLAWPVQDGVLTDIARDQPEEHPALPFASPRHVIEFVARSLGRIDDHADASVERACQLETLDDCKGIGAEPSRKYLVEILLDERMPSQRPRFIAGWGFCLLAPSAEVIQTTILRSAVRS